MNILDIIDLIKILVEHTLIDPISSLISIFSVILNIISNDFIGGFIHFCLNLFNYLSLLFIIIELFFMMFSLVNCKDEFGNKSVFKIIQNYITYHLTLIEIMFKSIMYIFSIIYKIVNTIIPM